MINIKTPGSKNKQKKLMTIKIVIVNLKIISKHVTNEETKNVEKVPKCEKPSLEKLIRW